MPDEQVTEERIDDWVAWATKVAADTSDTNLVLAASSATHLARVVLELAKRADRHQGVSPDGYGLVLPQRFIEDRPQEVATLAIALGRWVLDNNRERALAGYGPEISTMRAEAVAAGLFDKIARTVTDEPF